MASKYCYLGELVMVKHKPWNYGGTEQAKEKIYMGIVAIQYNRKEVQVNIISSDWPGGFPRFKNVRNPPTFDAHPDNTFQVLNEEKGRER